ncbi:PRC-barrel domain-containing protein [Methylobacterium gnaphalii]|uniref:PRC-barrel domain-containing protein n=1 Tax=Methylobacterium gnaphalii TaxID=1010610 RepID=A0A512JGE4_9HYPH|nr:PRC-barrel domain-containing protein [Methylobacterium gnaphalii]GEP09028.1 hypothetical protein MGN01_08730 [Methylobacterium gnaphalii]GJD71537.1 hypothetical protein MMMDOFMJ_4499 [Methylobacterium gnaphalii]GLS48951.1 hypothetical protein GCM10007885_17980 [Methylobacterium gnaphalii]
MRTFALALATAAALAGPALAKDDAPAPPSAVKFAQVPGDAVLSYNLIGLNVVDGSNSNVGEIKDLVIEKGKLAGYVLSVGGFLGIGEHYVVVDPSSVALTYDEGGKKWKASVNATKDQLKVAPQFKYEGKYKR